MWKIALVCLLFCSAVSAGRYPRNATVTDCEGGSVRVGDECLKKAVKLGDDCEDDLQCDSLNAVCVEGVCQSDNSTVVCEDENFEVVDGSCVCKEGYVEAEDGKSCLKEAKLGEACVSCKQCEAVNGTCIDNVCSELVASAAHSPLGEFPPEMGSLPVANITASVAARIPVIITSLCSSNDDCSAIESAVCKENICQCDSGHIPKEDLSGCLPIAQKAGEPCEEDKQCSKIPNSSCLEGKCSAVKAAGFRNHNNGSSKTSASALTLLTGLCRRGENHFQNLRLQPTNRSSQFSRHFPYVWTVSGSLFRASEVFILKISHFTC
ncbi:UNVERIFIED_CONTAM: hypothetical protein PYX00_004370 [Menopon gallinae]|uniref:EB domain-containing protein n=1 Tax=Menopon gallinae TaxID=328185 RepID=A0AAW2I420_9NEOP